MTQTGDDFDDIHEQARLLIFNNGCPKKRQSFLLKLQLRVIFGISDFPEELVAVLNYAININYIASVSKELLNMQQAADLIAIIFVSKLLVNLAKDVKVIEETEKKIEVMISRYNLLINELSTSSLHHKIIQLEHPKCLNSSLPLVRPLSFFQKPAMKFGIVPVISAAVLGTCIYAILSISMSSPGMAMLIIAVEIALCSLLCSFYQMRRKTTSFRAWI